MDSDDDEQPAQVRSGEESDVQDVQSGGEAEAQAPTSSNTKTAWKSNDKIKKNKPGIVYLSTIPYHMTVKSVREYFSKYGEIDRLFLQREIRVGSSGKKEKRYTEGWIEFKDKDLAKRIAASLNNSMVGGRRRSKAYESLWNLKYLHGFKWVHLNEQLTYENAVHQQKMRTEISQAKREANYFAEQIEKGENLRRLEEKVLKKGGLWKAYERQIKQKKSVVEKKRQPEVDGAFLGMILSGDKSSNKKRKITTDD